MKTVLSWHKKNLEQLLLAYKNNRFSHALLFLGIKGIGKEFFAKELVNIIFCKENNQTIFNTKNNNFEPNAEEKFYCGSCKNCNLLRANTHPDLTYLTKESSFSVDDIRAISTQFNTTSQIAKYKIAIIANANNLNINASNALLKTLEEPQGNKIIILTTSNKNLLPQTIISRCNVINFTTPKIAVAKNFLFQSHINSSDVNLLLAITNGAPLEALDLFKKNFLKLHEEIIFKLCAFITTQKNLIDTAAFYNKLETELFFISMINILLDIIFLKTKTENFRIINLNYKNDLQKISDNYSSYDLFVLYDFLLQNKAMIKKFNLNKQLVIENFLIKWIKAKC